MVAKQIQPKSSPESLCLKPWKRTILWNWGYYQLNCSQCNNLSKGKTDSSSFVKVVESIWKFKVLHLTCTDLKKKLSSFGLNTCNKAVGIFGACHLDCSEDGVIIDAYTNANNMIKNLTKRDTEVNVNNSGIIMEPNNEYDEGIKNAIFVSVLMQVQQ